MKMPDVELEKMTPVEFMAGADAEESKHLQEMLRRARGYLRGFRWCPPIDRVYLGCGAGGVVAVFLFHFGEPVQGTDEWLWVVEGDLPSAYLVLDRASDPVSALEVYCELMEGWCRGLGWEVGA